MRAKHHPTALASKLRRRTTLHIIATNFWNSFSRDSLLSAHAYTCMNIQLST
jgi:hypothetical protein